LISISVIVVLRDILMGDPNSITCCGGIASHHLGRVLLRLEGVERLYLAFREGRVEYSASSSISKVVLVIQEFSPVSIEVLQLSSFRSTLMRVAMMVPALGG
jgi:hypothetical protein